MKHNILFILTALGLAGVIAILLVLDANQSFSGRYHQHKQLTAEMKTVLHFTEIETHLPVISIQTNGKKIPGTPIKGLDNTYELSEENKTYIESSFTLYQGSELLQSEMIQVNYRGNSSRHFDKKSYSIRFIDENENDLEIPLLNMGADNNWALHGPYLDRSLIRNYIAMNWTGEIMDFAPGVRFVELFVDDSYEGLYVLMERISRGRDRVSFAVPQEHSHKTGYIVRLDRKDKIGNSLNDFVMDTFKIYPSGTELRYPTVKRLTEERQQFVKQDFSNITYSMYQMPYDIKYDYAEVLNVQAFYDYFIINELFYLKDAGQYSTYFYRDLRGKLTPVVWDFNNGLNNYQDSIYDDGSGFVLTHSIFYEQLLKDKKFVDGLIRRYHYLRKTILETNRMHQYIDETIDFLAPAISRNNERWGTVYDLSKYDSPNYLHPVDRNVTNYQEAVQQVKDYLEKRADWLDRHINTLYQYSHPSRIGHQAVK